MKKKIERSFPRFLPDFEGRFDTEEQLQQYYAAYYPGGSGPLQAMRVICALLEKIAEEKGWVLKKPGEE